MLPNWVWILGVGAMMTSGLDVQGHRGARGLRPENSIAAFQKALELRVTTLELDLHVTRDDHLIVEHDPVPDPKRCVRDNGSPPPTKPFKDLFYAELADIDCGRRPHPSFPLQERIPQTRIPRLEDVFELARKASYPVRMNIEIKLEDPKTSVPINHFVDLVIRVVSASGLADRVTIQSFDPEALLRVGQKASKLLRAMLVEHRADYDALVKKTGAQILSPAFGELQKADIAHFHALGVRVIPWTVNEVADIRRLIEWGVDGIISDYPDRVH